MKAASLSVGLLLVSSAHATHFYLSPPSQKEACHVLPGFANNLLSQHLGLDFFDPLVGDADSFMPVLNSVNSEHGAWFIGQGSKDALLLSIDEGYAKDVLPDELSSPFTVSRRHSSSQSLPVAAIMSKYPERARYIYADVYTSSSSATNPLPPPRTLDLFALSPSDATTALLSDLATLTDLLESDSSLSSAKFGAFDLGQRLRDISTQHGRQSEHYALAASAARAVLSSAFAKSTASPNTLNLAVITYPRSSRPQPQPHARRSAAPSASAQPPPQSPLPPNVPNAPDGSSTLSSCFASAEACSNATDTCSGHGSCVASGTGSEGQCFACACGVTTDAKGRREWWAGNACERKDVSGPFVLLTGTGIAAILLIVGSISLLYSIGTEELPSVLTSTASAHHRSN